MDNQNVFVEIWRRFRPYFIAISVDFLISASIWLGLFLFKRLTKHLAVDGVAGELIVNIHAAGAVGVYVLFAIMSTLDLFAIHRRESHREE